MRKLVDFLVEMRRRRVFRVAAVYVLGAWVVLQVADLAFAAFGLAPQALRFAWIGAVLCFPFALLLGWRFDIVGGRIIHITNDGEETDVSLRMPDYLIMAALAVVIGITLYGLGSEIAVERPARADAPVAAHPRSIAVLPFAIRGPAADSASLAAGIQDDLLTRLSRVADLQVISRTSTERYRDGGTPVREIGRELRVSKLIEGQVQHHGDRVRINVQLIDAETDSHLWASTYERSTDGADVFTIQSDIVESVANQLQATLTPRDSAGLAVMPTQSLDAYSAYLRGQQQFELVSIESLHRAIDHYRDAIALDPGFKLAHVALADAYLALGSNFYGGLPAEEAIAQAEPPLTLALSQGPELGEAQATLGVMRVMQNRHDEAEAAFDRALELAPNYSYAWRMYARLRWVQQRRDDALAMTERALALNPHHAPANFDVARYNDVLGNFDEALARYLRVVELKPDYAFAYVYIAAIYYLVHGRADESLVWYHRAADADMLSPSLRASPAIAYLELGDADSARGWVESGLALGPKSFWSLWTSVLLKLHEGDEDGALDDARLILDIYPKFAFALRVLRDADLAAGRVEVARDRYARAYREFVEPEVPQVDRYNYRGAIDFALVLQQTGETGRAADLLAGSLEVIATLPRLGTDGYWINDARIHALQGKPELALDALNEATDSGWRILTWYFLDRDPCLESIRWHPEFDRVRARIRDDLSRQADKVAQLKAAGELRAARVDGG